MKTLICILLFLMNFISGQAFSFDKDSATLAMYDVKIKEGEFYMYHQNFQRSIEIYNDLFTKDKEDVLVNYRLGVCLYFIDKEDEAEKYFDIASADSWYHTRILLFKEMQQANPKTLWW